MSLVVEAPSELNETNLHEYLFILRRRWVSFAQTFVVVMTLGVVITLLTRPIYHTSAKVLVSGQTASVNIVDVNNPLNTVLGQMQPDGVPAQMEQLQSAEFLREAMKRANLDPTSNYAAASLQVRIVDTYARYVPTSIGAQVLEISAESAIPKAAADLANAAIRLHVEQSRAQARQGLAATTEFVRKAQTKAAKDLSTAEARLIEFRRRNPVMQLEAAREMRNKEIVDLTATVRSSASTISQLRAQVAELRARVQKEPPFAETQTTRENPRYERLTAKLDELQLQRLDLVREYVEESAPVQQLDAQIASVKADLRNEPPILKLDTPTLNPALGPFQLRLAQIEADLQGQIADHNRAQAALKAKLDQVEDFGPAEVELSRLTHEKDAAQAAYTTYTDKLRDLEIRGNAQPEYVRPLETAKVPSAPVKPRVTLNILMTAVLALLLGAAAALLQEFLDDRVNSPDDVERFAALPNLGHVPIIREKALLMNNQASNSHIAEAYRTVRSSIGFASIDAPLRRLMVTSANKGEGKTTTAINLAVSMAMDGKRVILIDADLRRPSLHRVMSVPSSPGLSEVLAGMRSVHDVLQATDVPGLQIIPAGPIPPNPAELLGSEVFDRTLSQLDELADLIVVDTPPCIPVTDPLRVAPRVDGIVLVLHVGETRKPAVRHTFEMLARARARVLGVVYNQVQSAGGRYGYYYNSYYQRYGYYADYRYTADPEPDSRSRRRNGTRERKGLGTKSSAAGDRHSSDRN